MTVDDFDARVRAWGIVVSSTVRNGQPRIGTRSGITTRDIAERFRAGDEAAFIARDFNLDVSQVLDALRFELCSETRRRAWRDRQLARERKAAE